MNAVVIPSYKVREHILGVISGIGSEIQKIYVVDDACPEQSGKFVEENCKDARVKVLFHSKNRGVGGAVKTGYQQAIQDNIDVVVKLDGDGQMDSSLIPSLIKPILLGDADYVKGNRFFNLTSLRAMQGVRLFGNSMLSILNKFVNGYWNLMDPTNGFTAIHSSALKMLELDKIADNYFFESDMLFRLGTIRAVVHEMPMDAVYGNEKSNLHIGRILFEFPPKYFTRFFKRIFYNYFLRDFNAGTIELLIGLIFLIFGGTIGSIYWYQSLVYHQVATSGTVMLAALPTILGFQLLISGLQYDIRNIPTKPLQKIQK